MYNLRYLELLFLIYLLHLFALSYGQDQTPEGNGGEDNAPTRKRPILRKIIILVGLAIGLAFLAWCLHKTYKACCRWSRNRRQKMGRKEFDDMMKDLEEQEKKSSMHIKKEDLGASASGKYVPLNSVIAEEEPLMHPNVDGSTKRASQPGKNDAPSTPLLEDVPLDDLEEHKDQPKSSTPPDEEIVIRVD